VGNPATFGKAYSVTGEEWMTWEQMIGAAAAAMGAPEPTFVRIPTDLLARMAPKAAEWCVENFRFNNLFDNSAAVRDLGFRCTISWAEGCRRMVA